MMTTGQNNFFSNIYQFIHENYHFNLFVAIFRKYFKLYVLVLESTMCMKTLKP